MFLRLLIEYALISNSSHHIGIIYLYENVHRKFTNRWFGMQYINYS